MITKLEDLKEPIEPIKPDSVRPLFEESQEWDKYLKDKNIYEESKKTYEKKKELLSSLGDIKQSVAKVFSNKDKEGILNAINEKGLNIDEKEVDKYLKTKVDIQKDIESKKQVIENLNYNSIHHNTSGIDYTNDILKAEESYSRASNNSSLSKQVDEIAIKMLLYKSSNDKDPKSVIDALEELEYDGDFGKLQPVKNLNDEIKRYKSEVERMSKEVKSQKAEISQLKEENKSIRESNEIKQIENDELIKDNKAKNTKINELENKGFWKSLGQKIASRFKGNKTKQLVESSNKEKVDTSERNGIRDELKQSVVTDVTEITVNTTRRVEIDDRAK